MFIRCVLANSSKEIFIIKAMQVITQGRLSEKRNYFSKKLFITAL